MALALGHTDSRYEPHGRVLEPSAARPRASGDVFPRQNLARWGRRAPWGTWSSDRIWALTCPRCLRVSKEAPDASDRLLHRPLLRSCCSSLVDDGCRKGCFVALLHA